VTDETPDPLAQAQAVLADAVLAVELDGVTLSTELFRQFDHVSRLVARMTATGEAMRMTPVARHILASHCVSEAARWHALVEARIELVAEEEREGMRCLESAFTQLADLLGDTP
jgi:hypothetical protein